MKQLYCHTSLAMYGNQVLTEGKFYIISQDNEYDYVIRDDENTEHAFTKMPDHKGRSYLNWFTLEEKEREVIEDQMSLIIYINEEFEDERALYDLGKDELLLKGDIYHDKIDDMIAGYLQALEDFDIYIEDVEEVWIDITHKNWTKAFQ